MIEYRLTDLLKTGSLWGAIQQIESFPFVVENSPQGMDLMLDNLYGQRVLFSAVINKPLEDVAKMIVMLNGSKWKKLIEIDLFDFDNHGGNVRKLTETITENQTRTNTRDDLNKVSAFNDDTLVVNDGVTSTGNEGVDNSKIRTLSDGNYSLNSAYYSLNLSTKNHIITLVMQDVASFMTKSIY